MIKFILGIEDKENLEMCDKFVDVKDFVANSCDGQQSCDILGTFKFKTCCQMTSSYIKSHMLIATNKMYHITYLFKHYKSNLNRYRRKRPKLDASNSDSALSHTRRSDASEKIEENSVSTCGHFRLWTSFESSPVSVK